MAPSNTLSFAGLTLAFGERQVFGSLALDIPVGGLQLLLGPSRSGKSVLLKWLAGHYDASTNFAVAGQVSFLGQPLEADRRPVLAQLNLRDMHRSVLDCLLQPLRDSARLTLSASDWQAYGRTWLVENGWGEVVAIADMPLIDCPPLVRRMLMIAAPALLEPALLMIDEPLADLAPEDAQRLLSWLAALASRQPLLLAASDEATLAAHVHGIHRIDNGGTSTITRLQACQPEAAEAAAVADLPEPCQASIQLVASVGEVIVRDRSAPAGFHWIVPGRLAACIDLHKRDSGTLEQLARLGINRVVTLAEGELDHLALAAHGLRRLYLPLSERTLPSFAQMHMLLLRIERLLKQSETILLHSNAEESRSGLVLAAWMLRNGTFELAEACDRLRAIAPVVQPAAAHLKFLEGYIQDLALRTA